MGNLSAQVKRLERELGKSVAGLSAYGRPWNGKVYLVLFDNDPEPNPERLASYQFKRFEGVIRIPFVDAEQATAALEGVAEQVAPAIIDWSLSDFEKVSAVGDWIAHEGYPDRFPWPPESQPTQTNNKRV